MFAAACAHFQYVSRFLVLLFPVARAFPRYESIIGVLCDALDALDEPEARAAMVWIIGEYAERIDNADELLESFLEARSARPAEKQLVF